jgi:RimJ/RimL family protein N-acetyltransferase
MRELSINAGVATLRTWRLDDVDDLVARADNRAVWMNMTDMFPSPYTQSDGTAWIARCRDQDPPRDLVIAVADSLVGGCGFVPREGVEAGSGVIGYWLAESHWGRGIASAAVKAFLGYVWESFAVHRLEARVFGWNPASSRVLDKNGFVLEGRRRNAIRKDGRTTDELIYGLLRDGDA